MWTLKWGAKSGPCFGVRRIVFPLAAPQNGVQILGPILRSTLPVFFSQRDAEKGHPRVGCCEQVRFLQNCDHALFGGFLAGCVDVLAVFVLVFFLFVFILHMDCQLS